MTAIPVVDREADPVGAVADRRRRGAARTSRDAADPDRSVCGRVPVDQVAGVPATRRSGIRVRRRRRGLGAGRPGARLGALRVDRRHVRFRARLHGRMAVPPAGTGVRGGLAGTGELPGVVGSAPALREPVRHASVDRGARPGCGSVVARRAGRAPRRMSGADELRVADRARRDDRRDHVPDHRYREAALRRARLDLR